MRKFIIAAFCLTIFIQFPTLVHAQADMFDAQEEETAKPSGGMRTVTPISKCLDQLPEADAIEVRGNYLKPYQECQRRLHSLKHSGADDAKTGGKKARSKKAATDGEDAGEEPESKKAPAPAEDARNFVRVRKDDSPRRPASYGDAATPEAPKNPPRQGNRAPLYNR